MTARPLSAIVPETWNRAKQVTQETAALVKTQTKKHGAAVGAGTGLIVAALATIVVIPPLLLTALVLGLVAMGLWPWAACLIVAGAAILLCLGLALAGMVVFKRVGKATSATVEQVKGTINAFSGTGATDQDSHEP